MPGALLSAYDHVIWKGVTYSGHWSWIYAANNDPVIKGTHLWQWMSRQNLTTGTDRPGSTRGAEHSASPSVSNNCWVNPTFVDLNQE